jgi:hypothetical protein
MPALFGRALSETLFGVRGEEGPETDISRYNNRVSDGKWGRGPLELGAPIPPTFNTQWTKCLRHNEMQSKLNPLLGSPRATLIVPPRFSSPVTPSAVTFHPHFPIIQECDRYLDGKSFFALPRPFDICIGSAFGVL